MGEVYRATDTKLKREVAIKVLPAAFTEDRERLARFEREAQLLAQLHHPNIASIFGLEDANGIRALVLELVEGPTLADRLAQGALPLDESLRIAVQIAHALEEAHEKGIVHRDLKPQNIKASLDGKVKVLDFGLAKAMDPVSAASGPGSATQFAQSPTLTLGATQMGMVLGTAAYMAPEQARGVAVDKRADIWAFGVVLFEMIAGRRLFEGELVTDVLANVLKSLVDVGSLPAGTPAAVRRLLRRCLERNPKNRLHDIADARIVLEDLASGRSEENESAPAAAAPAPRRPAWSRWLPWGLVAVASFAAIAMTVVLLRGPRAEPARTMRFQVPMPESSAPTRRGSFFELSPDGRFLVMAGSGALWVRPVDSVSARRLEGVTDATYPFWSPDGAWIGFFAENQLKKVAREGGAVQKICDALDGRGGAWGADGLIVFADQQGSRGLKRVPSQGGQPTSLTQVMAEGANQYHRYPQFLPGGRSFLYQYLVPSPELAGVYLGTVDGDAPVRVLEGGDQALYAPDPGGAESGHLLFRRQSALLAQQFDPGRRRTDGEPRPVADDVGIGANTGSGAFSVSQNGMLAFRGELLRSGALTWVDRAGKTVGTVVAETQEINGISLARGGRRVAFGQGRPPDIWTVALPGGDPSRFTFGPAPGWSYPLWSPDGAELVYTTFDLVGLPRYEIRRRRADRAGTEETLVSAQTTLYTWDWSPDGGSILFGDDAADLWLLPLTGDRKPVPFLVARGMQALGQISPDGRLVAYASDEQGQFEVFVTTLPPSGALWQISTGGGNMPRWRRDGRELFFRAADGTLMAVALGPRGSSGGGAGGGTATIEERGAPRPLFAGIPSSGNTQIFTYSPADDGQRFLVASTRSDDWQRITLVVNWQSELAARATGGAP